MVEAVVAEQDWAEITRLAQIGWEHCKCSQYL